MARNKGGCVKNLADNGITYPLYLCHIGMIENKLIIIIIVYSPISNKFSGL